MVNNVSKNYKEVRPKWKFSAILGKKWILQKMANSATVR